MTNRPVLEPTPAHPISIAPTGKRVLVRVDGVIVADTHKALQLQESNYPAVQYIPLKDVHRDLLTPTDTSTYCPYKGEAAYYGVTTPGGDRVDDVIWYYENPYPAVAAIADHVAFYPNKADISLSD